MSRARDIADLSSVSARLDTVGGSEGALSNRNLIINGAMTVGQRDSLTSFTYNTNSYGECDRWDLSGENGTAVVTASKDTDSPNGFANSLKIDVTTADTSMASNAGARIIQRLEGQNVQMIKKGTSDAEKLTLSFYVKSPKTGTHCLELLDIDNNRSVSAAYTVSAANTWESVAITFPADTTGAFDNDNAQSLLVIWWLAAGSDYSSGTLNTVWGSRVEANRAVGQVNVLDDAANNFFLTGVQLEVGDTATDFEHRKFSDELHACKRYYQKMENATYSNNLTSSGTTGHNYSHWWYVPEMRASPTLTGVVGGTADSPNKQRAQHYAQNANYSYYNVGATADAEL